MSRKEQNEFIDLLEECAGTWEETFWKKFDPKTMTIDEKSLKKLKTKGYYKDKTFRRWWCIIYWFECYAKQHFGFDLIHIVDGKYAYLMKSDDPTVRWVVWFENNHGKMFVPYCMYNENNRLERYTFY